MAKKLPPTSNFRTGEVLSVRDDPTPIKAMDIADPCPSLDDLFYEIYVEWLRLHKFPPPAQDTMEMLVDEATGMQRAHMILFVQWFVTDVMARLKVE